MSDLTEPEPSDSPDQADSCDPQVPTAPGAGAANGAGGTSGERAAGGAGAAGGERATSDEKGTEGPRKVMADLEDGVAHLFAAFEQGVMKIAQAEGDKRRANAARTAALATGTAPGSGPAATPAAPDETDATESASESAATDGATHPALEQGDPVAAMTYDDALSPIRWRNVLLGLIAVVVLAVFYWAATLLGVWTAADDDETQPADAIVVLGAAQFDGTPSPILALRLDHALDLWNDDLADYIVTTGSNRQGDRFTEGFSGYVYLRDAGVPEDAILTIVDGADTYQQMTAALAQLQDRELSTALLVSDGYHNRRLRSIATEIGLEAFVSPTGLQATRDDYLRETTAVSIGRLIGYRRLSAWNTTEPRGE